MHGPLRQAHGEDGDGDGQYNCDNQHGDVVDNGLHQLVIAGTHLLYGSGKRALFHKLWWFGGIKASQAGFGLCIFVLLRGFIKNENETSVWKD